MKIQPKNLFRRQSFWNFIENTIAYAMPVFFQQFIVYPLMAKKLGAEENGLFLALISLNYFVLNITVSILVNTRLLKNRTYEGRNVKGDYNVFVLIFALINSAVVLGGTFFYCEKVTVLKLLLSVLVCLLFVYHDYITVQYRAELRFKNILVNNILICIGYLIGLAILWFWFPYWQIVFIVPYTMTAVYDFFHTDYIKEPLRITPLFKDTFKQYLILLGSSLLGTIVTYGDRLILYPLMDGATVSIFSSAQLIGKMLQMISTPLSTFLLAYLVKRASLKLKLTAKHYLLAAGVGIVLYGLCVLVSNPMIHFLYPGWADEALKYVPFTAATGLLHMVNAILNVFVLRFGKQRWQLIKSSVYLVGYMGFSFSLLHFFDLYGFCIGNLLATAIESILLAFLFLKKTVIKGHENTVA